MDKGSRDEGESSRCIDSKEKSSYAEQTSERSIECWKGRTELSFYS